MDTAQVAGAKINRERREIATEAAAQLIGENRELLEAQGLSEHDLVEYALHDLSKLFIAVISHRPQLFVKYIQWQRSVFYHRDIPAFAVAVHLETLGTILQKRLLPEEFAVVAEVLDAGQRTLAGTMLIEESFIDVEAPYSAFAVRYLELLRDNRERDAVELIENAVDEGISIEDIYVYIIQPVQQEIGRLWQINEITVAEEHAATEISRGAMAALRRRIVPPYKRNQRILTACLGGELHDLGARMVSDFFYLAGYESYFTGANTPHRIINDELHKRSISVLALSATMTIQVRQAIDLIDAVKKEFADSVQILVGGYAFNEHPTLWRDVGADGFAPDAREAVRQVEKMLGE